MGMAQYVDSAGLGRDGSLFLNNDTLRLYKQVLNDLNNIKRDTNESNQCTVLNLYFCHMDMTQSNIST